MCKAKALLDKEVAT
jgi:hypothetical protein